MHCEKKLGCLWLCGLNLGIVRSKLLDDVRQYSCGVILFQ